MRYLKLSLTHLKKNLLPVIIAVLQVSIAVVIINIIFSSVMQTFGMNIFAKGFDDSHLFALTKREMQTVTGMTQEESRQYHAAWENGYAEDMNIPLEEIANYINSYDSYCWRNRHEYSDGTFKEMSYSDIKNLYRENTAEMENIISKNPDVLDCSSIDMLPFEPYENDLFAASYFEIWNDALADKINMNVTRGKNISETQNLGDTIEAVISGRKEFLNKISLGEKFDIRLYNYELGQYETKTVKIAGILNSPYYTLTGGSWFSGEDTVGLSDLVQRTNVSEGSKEILLFIKPFEGYDKFRYLPQQSDNHYLTVQNNISEDALENLKSDFLNIGYNVKSTKTAYDNSHKIGVQLVMTDIVTIIISLLTALVSSVGSIMLIIFKDKKMFDTYYRCGGTLKHNMYIIGINMALIILISAVISITGISIWNYKNIIETHELFGLTFDKWNILISVAFYLLTSVIISIIAVAHFSKAYSGKENDI